MSTLDGKSLFASGPSSTQCGPAQRDLERRTVPGQDGELVLDLGMRARTIVHGGYLQAATAAELAQQIAAIEQFLDGSPHTLIDEHGLVHSGVIMERFEPAGAIRRGRGFWCQYACHFLQLP